jgi:hypothetical protein
MSSPINAVLTGSFTSLGTQINLVLPSGYSEFKMTNITDIGSAAANTNVMVAEGTSLMPAGSAIYQLKTNGAATLQIPSMTLTNGFTFVADSDNGTPGPLIPLTAAGNTISQAAPAVVLTGNTAGLIAGVSLVRLINTVGMENIASMVFTVGAIVNNVSFTLQNLDTSGVVGGFGANATNGSYRAIPFPTMFSPRYHYITNISLAAQARITMSVTHGLTVGQAVRILVPAGWGTTQMNGLLGTVTAIGQADVSGFTNTIDVNINSSAFTAFTFPTSAVAAGGIGFAQVVPVGETAVNTLALPVGNVLDDRTLNVSFRGIQIGTTVQTTGKLYQWIAKQGLTV